MKLRRCLLEDIDEVIRIEQESFTHPYDRFTFLYYLRDPYSSFIVAEDDGRIIGYLVYSLKGRKATLVSIAVKKDERSKGIGKRLLNEAIKELSGKVDELWLQVGVRNKDAIAFYKKAGFQPKWTIARYYQDGEDALVMVKRLTSSSYQG